RRPDWRSFAAPAIEPVQWLRALPAFPIQTSVLKSAQDSRARKPRSPCRNKLEDRRAGLGADRIAWVRLLNFEEASRDRDRNRRRSFHAPGFQTRPVPSNRARILRSPCRSKAAWTMTPQGWASRRAAPEVALTA